jgi:hypothetical protein
MHNVTHNDLLSNPAFIIQVNKAAALAHTCMASDNGRISRAVELVLAGAVEAAGCGRWDVASACSFPERWYRVYNGGCNCPDYAAHAHIVPNHLCKHLIAVGLYQRACQEMEREHMQYEVPEPTRDEMEAMIETENARPDKCWQVVDPTLGRFCHEVHPECPGHAGIDFNTGEEDEPVDEMDNAPRFRLVQMTGASYGPGDIALAFQVEVNRWLSQGWQLHGPTTCQFVPSPETGIHYCQALVR